MINIMNKYQYKGNFSTNYYMFKKKYNKIKRSKLF